MLFKKLFLYSLLLSAVICSSDDIVEDCSLVDCLSVDNSIYLKFLTDFNGENLITNGTYDASQISIQNANDDTVSFELQTNFENEDVLVIDLQEVAIGEQAYQIQLGDMTPFTFAITTFADAGSFCCGPYTGIDDASLSGADGEFANIGILPIEVTVLVP